MQFDSLCQFDTDEARSDLFDRIVRAGPWKLATLDGLLARDEMPFSAVLVHDQGAAIELTLERISHQRTAMAVIGYRETIDPGAVVDALHAGAIDYVAWPINTRALSDRLKVAASRAAKCLRDQLTVRTARRRFTELTSREREVLEGLTNGATNKTIALKLGISARTVEIHRSNMLSKIGAASSAEAVMMATRADLF